MCFGMKPDTTTSESSGSSRRNARLVRQFAEFGTSRDFEIGRGHSTYRAMFSIFNTGPRGMVVVRLRDDVGRDQECAFRQGVTTGNTHNALDVRAADLPRRACSKRTPPPSSSCPA